MILRPPLTEQTHADLSLTPSTSRRSGRRNRIEIDIPRRSIRLAVDAAELGRRRAAMVAKGSAAWKPAKRSRKVLAALKAYAAMTTSAAHGAVRVVRD